MAEYHLRANVFRSDGTFGVWEGGSEGISEAEAINSFRWMIEDQGHQCLKVECTLVPKKGRRR